MIYKNKQGESIIAYRITNVIETIDSYSLSLPEFGAIIGFWKDKLNFIPQVGDFYIHKDEIIDSEVMSAESFLSLYTEV
jgi:hypothetical protein